eukprot:TRINITY_DN3189_c0_g1_i2.p1 TRINITY_DN3189_c0_g1~~TRINITY_DN3189_c0_g1_i2.p1  ORF type:complete len:246 (-),score=44.88 TRINITY_DN3189_c0_g1_i2:95-832(-)
MLTCPRLLVPKSSLYRGRTTHLIRSFGTSSECRAFMKKSRKVVEEANPFDKPGSRAQEEVAKPPPPGEEVLMLPGKTNNLLAFYLNHKRKILIGVPVVSILGFFGIKTVFVFAFKAVAGVLGLGAIVGLALWQTRKRSMSLYDEIIKGLHKNRKKIEESIGSFEMPEKGDIQTSKGKTEFPGKKFDTINYFFRLSGTEGHAFVMIEAIEIPKQGKEFKRELKVVKFILQTHGMQQQEKDKKDETE